jgi:hypothetical protein
MQMAIAYLSTRAALTIAPGIMDFFTETGIMDFDKETNVWLMRSCHLNTNTLLIFLSDNYASYFPSNYLVYASLVLKFMS